jgi:predicted Ser/Thr protein kinase
VSCDPARVAALFDEAAELADAELSAFLDERCGDDEPLRAALQRLLAHDRDAAPEFLAAPPVFVTTAAPAAAAPGWPEGMRVGRFLIVREIGRGAMGSVYAAYDEVLDRKIALKRLHGGTAHQRAAVLREARALARLSHPNVVQVHEVVESGSEILLAMELVQGASLRTWAAERERDWRALLAIFIQSGRGLAAAHATGVVHGDFKPDNVLIGDDERVRVVDFGVAALIARGDDDGSRPQLGGTPAFMAPEQFHGHPATPRSDQYGFCVALYACLFGRHPHPGDTLDELLASHEVSPRPPLVPGLPAALPAIVLRGLARTPSARWPDMDALLDALSRLPGLDREADLGVARRQRLSIALVMLAAGLTMITYHFGLREQAAAGLQPRDLVHVMGLLLAVLMVLIVGLWRSLRRNRINRQIAGLLLASTAAMLLHRAIALRLGTPVPHTLIVDLVLLQLAATVAALAIHRRFALLAGLVLLAVLAATANPSRASPLFLGTVLVLYALGLVWWWRSR